MDLSSIAGHNLRGLDTKKILLGKNGCGKSWLLKQVDQALRSHSDYGVVRYLSPERGGLLQYEPNIEHNTPPTLAG